MRPDAAGAGLGDAEISIGKEGAEAGVELGAVGMAHPGAGLGTRTRFERRHYLTSSTS